MAQHDARPTGRIQRDESAIIDCYAAVLNDLRDALRRMRLRDDARRTMAILLRHDARMPRRAMAERDVMRGGLCRSMPDEAAVGDLRCRTQTVEHAVVDGHARAGAGIDRKSVV